MIRITDIHLVDKYMDQVEDILIDNGKILAIGKEKIEAIIQSRALVEVAEKELLPTEESQQKDNTVLVWEGKGKYLSPSFVDLHFHLRNPGQEHKQTFEEASQAAIRGGYTKVVAMANTVPIVDSIERIEMVENGMNNLPLKVIQTAAVSVDLRGQEVVDFEKLREKTFIFSDDGRNVDRADIMEQALIKSKELDFIIMDHDEPETQMVIRNIELAKKTQGRIHFCHISKKESIDAIVKAKKEQKNITFEVSPHHIFSTNLDYRVNPPIGNEEDQKAILRAIQQGQVDAIATDHAPHTQEDKAKGAPGIVTIETAFSMVRKIFSDHGISLQTQITLMSNNPSEILGVDNRLAEGAEANLVIYSDQETRIDSSRFATRSKNTPFDGWESRGKVEYTIVEGRVYTNL